MIRTFCAVAVLCSACLLAGCDSGGPTQTVTEDNAAEAEALALEMEKEMMAEEEEEVGE